MFPLKLENTDKRALYFVSLREHAYTVRYLIKALRERGIHAHHITWDRLFASTHLPHGTWILADFERLSASELIAAAKVRKALMEAGCRVLNDPGRWLPRADYLRMLFDSGINSYRCWKPSVGEMPDQFPVFLRRSSGHTGAESALIETAEEAETALNAALERGLVLSDLIFVEYAGAPLPGRAHYAKYAAYCVGGQIVRAVTVNDTNWMAKEGVLGLATEEDYAEELREMRDYPHEDFIWTVCDRAGLEFARVDFGERDGRFEVWEVNTNPTLYGIHPHPNPDRAESVRLSFLMLLEAVWRLARTPGAPVSIKGCFRRHSIENDVSAEHLGALHRR